MKKALFILPLFLFIFASSAFAVYGRPDSPGNSVSAKLKLTDAKLKACQAREGNVVKQMAQLTKMATNMLDVFDKIAIRVKDYYTASGKTVSSYDTLVAEVNTKKAAVQTALATAQTGVDTFTCEGDDPKGMLTQFRNQMGSVKSALKDYRTSINKLIVAVRSQSPKVTASPTAAQ